MDLEKLNKEQKEAVVHGKGPLLIVAGAGVSHLSHFNLKYSPDQTSKGNNS